jgi:hypothetical protein
MLSHYKKKQSIVRMSLNRNLELNCENYMRYTANILYNHIIRRQLFNKFNTITIKTTLRIHYC